MNMFKHSQDTLVDEYLRHIPPERQHDFYALYDLIQKAVPELEVHFAYNMLGFGKFTYVNYKKQEVDWPVIALANQKNYISLYVSCTAPDGQYIAEKHKDQLGKVSVGKSCIRIKKLEDVDTKVLTSVLKLAASNPGFAG